VSEYVNLGEGRLPQGPDRQLIAAMLVSVIRDYLKPETRAEAGSWLEGEIAAEFCACLGVPPRTLRSRLRMIVEDPELLIAMTRLLCRRTPAEVYAELMEAA
jgi:hypothetical protein